MLHNSGSTMSRPGARFAAVAATILATAMVLAAGVTFANDVNAAADLQDYGVPQPSATRSRLLEYIELLNRYRAGKRAAVIEEMETSFGSGLAVDELVAFPATMEKLARKIADKRRELAGVRADSFDVVAFIADPDASAKAGWGKYRTLEGEWAVYTVPELARIAAAVGYTRASPTVHSYLRLAAYVHSDVAQHLWEVKGRREEGQGHWRRAARALRPLETSEFERPFVKAWYLATIVRTFQATAFAETRFFLDRADTVLPRDPDVGEARGALYETLAMVFTRKMTIPGAPELKVKERAANLSEAEARLREAIAFGADATCRLRLGHVLALQGRGRDALGELASARSAVVRRQQEIAAAPMTDAQKRRALQHLRTVLYDISMVWGKAAESAGDINGARASYMAASAACPTAQSPLIALSHIAFDGKDWDGRLAALKPALVSESHDLARDPWWAYRYGGTWDLDTMLRELWEMVFK